MPLVRMGVDTVIVEHNNPYLHLIDYLTTPRPLGATPVGGVKPPAPVSGRSTPSTHDATFPKFWYRPIINFTPWPPPVGFDRSLPYKVYYDGTDFVLVNVDIDSPKHNTCADIPGAPIARIGGVMDKTRKGENLFCCASSAKDGVPDSCHPVLG
jgi:hypothetical protein